MAAYCIYKTSSLKLYLLGSLGRHNRLVSLNTLYLIIELVSSRSVSDVRRMFMKRKELELIATRIGYAGNM